jgi:FHS family L-fucose permease-like MFS transporter
LAVFTNLSAPSFEIDGVRKTDTRAMSVATSLFFMVGFLTCLNDIIIPHLKSIFELDYAEALLVQFAFFTSYFVFSYPGGSLVDRIGYKKTMVVGLLVMACGAVGFIPAAHFALFPIFLAALIVLAAGMTIVQVAVNPYVTVIGPPATASSRLNLAQAFNSVGTFIAPFFGSQLILAAAPPMATPERLHSMSDIARQIYRAEQASTVRLPYLGIALMLTLLALALAAIKLKTTTGVSQHTKDFRPGAYANALSRQDSIWRHPWLLFAALGIFTYVGAEVAIGSLLVNYMSLPDVAGIKESIAANFLMCYWGGAMLGRFIGSAVLQKVKTGIVLGLAALCGWHPRAHQHEDNLHLRRDYHVSHPLHELAGHLDPSAFATNVDSASGRLLQQHHVPVDLHPRHSGSRPSHQQRLKPADCSHPRRRDHPRNPRQNRRPHRPSSQLLHPRHLLRLHRGLRYRGHPPAGRKQHSHSGRASLAIPLRTISAVRRYSKDATLSGISLNSWFVFL